MIRCLLLFASAGGEREASDVVLTFSEGPFDIDTQVPGGYD